jgi:hypothetical protein
MIEAHKIGVSLAMTSNPAQVLGLLVHDLLGIDKQTQRTVSSAMTRRAFDIAQRSLSRITCWNRESSHYCGQEGIATRI